MPIQKNLNTAPYYDDFDPSKNYYRVLYKAGYPIQARELTTQQSILQDQVEQIASRFLTEGDNVVPGEFSLRSPVDYVILSSFTNGVTVQDFVGYTLTGVTSGVVAECIFAVAETNTDDSTLYITYISGGDTGEFTSFLEGEVLESSNPNAITANVGVSGTSNPTDISTLGKGALFRVSEGSYFIDGMAIRNTAQQIVVSKYTDRFDANVGFLVTETTINSNEDTSLLDNSQGSSNFAAPGADRLKIELTLVYRDRDQTDPNFVLLAEVIQGNVLATPGDTVKWDWLYDILARRTFDESGNYIVSEFGIGTLEYYNNENVDGLYNPDTNGDYPPLPSDPEGPTLTYDEANENYVVNISSGKAYVQGYEIDLLGRTYLYGKKARTTSFRSDTLTQITRGYNITITNVYGTPDFQNISGDGSAIAFDDVILYRNHIDGFVGQSTGSGQRPLNIGNKPWKTYHILADGNIGSSPSGYTEVYKAANGAVVNTSTTLSRGDSIGDATILTAVEWNPVPTGVITPRYMLPKEQVDDNDGFYGYSSTSSLGIMNAVYFTEIAVVGVTGTSSNWAVGELVEGELSGATGVVENGSNSLTLVVSNVNGEFLPGEEVVQGNKVSRIITESEAAYLIFIDKGTNNTTIDLSGETGIQFSALGSSITLTASAGDMTVTSSSITLTNQGRLKLLNFPFPNGSTQQSKLDVRGATIPNGVTTVVINRTPKVSNSLSFAKSVFSSLSDTNDFSADISGQSNNESEIISIANGSLFSADAQQSFLTCENFSGDASEELITGDLITFVDDSGITQTRIVLNATSPAGTGEVRRQSVVWLSVPIPNSVSGKTIQRIRIKTKGNSKETLIYQLPQETISTLETNPTNTNINYQVTREFITNLSSGSSTITLTTNRNNESFIENSAITSIVIAENISTPSDPNGLEGRAIVASDIDVTQDNGKKIVFTLDSSLTSSVKVKILVPVFVTDSKSKRKIARTETTLSVSAADAAKDIISLKQTDVYNVSSVMQNGVNILSNYRFDNGQRDNIYDISRLTLITGRPPASGNLTITYDYFEHSGDGDFFSVDSYTDESSVGYENIPTYTSSNIVTKESQYSKSKDKNTVFLRDVLDFRPAVNTSGSDPSVVVASTDGVDAQGSKNYRDQSNGGNAFAPRIPITSTQFGCDLEYYLPRYDTVFLESSGLLSLVSGEPAADPTIPMSLSSAIRLYDLFLPPYTFKLSDIYIKKYNYKRYQMKDIAKIDRKVQQLSELVTLSLLEQDAINMNVRDATTGLDRYKNGIVVDNFTNHSNGDVGTDQYRCSIDPKNGQLRSPFFIDQVELEEDVDTDSERLNRGYKNNNSIITLNYENADLISQPLATRSVNLQPYSVFTYKGQLALDPEIDTFSDKNTLPDVIIEDNTLWDAAIATQEASNGTVWSEWEVIDVETQSLGWRGGSRTDTTSQRTEVNTDINVTTSEIVNTSIGESVVDVQVAETMRTINVFFTVSNVKPKTRYYVFFDDIEVSDWIITDTINTDFPDEVARYDGNIGQSLTGFGQEIYSDDIGRITGVWLIPNGRPPVKDSGFDGNLLNVEYQTDGPTRTFATGTRLLKFIDNVNNPTNMDSVGAFAEKNFTSSGVVIDLQETIISTRIPEMDINTTVEVQQKVDTVIIQPPPRPPSPPPSPNPPPRPSPPPPPPPSPPPNDDDPVAQTFSIPSTVSSQGAFVTEVDLFFKTKDISQGVEVYLTTTEGQVPTETILPGSLVNKNSDTTLRVQCTTLDGDSTQIAAGTQMVGQTSGAVGTLKSNLTFESSNTNPTKNISNNVYNAIINNYDGIFVAGEVVVPRLSPEISDVFNITLDEYNVRRVDVKRLGTGYTVATVEFSPPELPGGVTASATALVANGMVYQIDVTNKGSGYTARPSVTINGDGTGATANVRVNKGRKAVNMGVATSTDATAATTFVFDHPIFLFPDTYYSIVAKAPTSINYEVYTAKMGENLLGTQTRVIQQPTLGALFMSQNGGLWTEDQTQDMAFVLKRAQFALSTQASIRLENVPLKQIQLRPDPIEFNSNGTDTTSNIFGDNPQVVKVYHHMNGLAIGDLVSLTGVTGDPGGIPNSEYNTIHNVLNVDYESFTIKLTTSSTESGKSGGTSVYSSYNRPYEVINVTTGMIHVGNSSSQSFVSTVQAAGITGYNASNQYTRDPDDFITYTTSYYATGPKQIASYLNEANNYQSLGGGTSFHTFTSMVSANAFVSPVLDLSRTNASIIRNLINDPYPSDDIFGTQSRTVTFDGDVSTAGISVGDDVTFTQDATSRIVKATAFNSTTNKLRLKGQYSKLLEAASTWDNATLESASIRSITTMEDNGFYPETDNNGSAYSKWISRLFEFENACDGIEIKLSAIFYSASDIKLYYKPRNIGFDGDFSEINWIPFNRIGLPDDVELIKPRSSDNVDPSQIPSSAWQELTFTTQDIPQFDGLSVKIVMTSQNPATAPLIDDIRIVASE